MKSPRQRFLELRPALPGLPGMAHGVGGEGVTALGPAEQKQPLAGDQPEFWIARGGDAAGDVERVVAAELRAVDFGMCQENAAVSLVTEPPHRAGLRRLEIRAA